MRLDWFFSDIERILMMIERSCQVLLFRLEKLRCYKESLIFVQCLREYNFVNTFLNLWQTFHYENMSACKYLYSYKLTPINLMMLVHVHIDVTCRVVCCPIHYHPKSDHQGWLLYMEIEPDRISAFPLIWSVWLL
jgi:hypothetical protein